MKEWVKANPYTTAAIVGAVCLTAALGTWLATRPKKVEFIPKKQREEIRAVMKVVQKGKKISQEDRKNMERLLLLDTKEGSLAEKFISQAEPLVQTYLALTARGAIIEAGASINYAEEIKDLDSILDQMEKEEKETGWFKRM